MARTALKPAARPARPAGRAAPRPAGRVGAASGPRWPRVRAWLVAALRSTLLGAALGAVVVVAVLYRGALDAVDRRLAGGPVWSVPGHIWSGPVEVWPGLVATPEELAEDLVAAGYARVPKAERAGDFQAADDAVLVKPKADAKRTHDVLVAFRDGRVSSVTPGGRAALEPAQLAVVRGVDNENRSPVPLARIPETVRHAVLAMEDARFYEHPGLDALGIARALWADVVAGRMVQGGSTLTQQLAKNVFLSSERTAIRKAQEALYALALEARLDKDRILELYLNEVYLGQANGSALGGVDAAARAWFDKPVERVTLGEAATIAGIIASPNAWSPLRDPAAARARRDVALDRMVAAGFLDRGVAEAAKLEPLVVHATLGGRRAPYLTDVALEEVESARGAGAVAREALEVHTALIPALQRLAERAVDEGVRELVAAHPRLEKVQAALVVVRAKDGAVVAMVGGRDYAASSYNRATLARRSIGSTVKPLTVLVALDRDPSLSGVTAFEDAPITRVHDGRSWSPANYDGVFVGPIDLRRALAGSRNVPAVLLAERVGLGVLKEKWRAMGLSGATDYPSAALGGFDATPMELAGAYTAFVGDHRARRPWVTRAALDGAGTEVWTRPTAGDPFRVSAQAGFRAWDLLRGVITEGTGRRAMSWGVGPGAAGKTGTTDDYKDAWFAGVSGGFAVVAWVGFDRGEKVGLTGGEAALPIWARFVGWSGTSGSAPGAPAGVVRAEVCVETGGVGCRSCETFRQEWFAAGHVPEDCKGETAIGEPEAPERIRPFQRLGELLGLGR